MTPIIYQWTGEAMTPLGRFAKQCDRDFIVGEHYRLEAVEERSWKSHRHYFAAIYTAWQNMPELTAERFPTSEHLRKYALVRTGYADQRSIVCSSKAEAIRVAAFVKPMDEFAIVEVRESVVIVHTAQSQSTKAMGAKVFQQSKTAVLDFLEDALSIERGMLMRQAKEVA